MFEIGSTLRDARVRKDISLQQAEDETKIRVKYIQAMENEDFEILPGGTYVKGFLRTYAEYLELDYQLLLDEYNDRFGSGDHREHIIQAAGRTTKEATPSTPRSQKNRNYIFVAVLAVAIIAVLAYLGWGNTASNEPTLITTTDTGTGTQTSTAPPAPAAQAPVATTPTQTAPAVIETVVFTSTSSDNWVELHRDSADGEVIWGGTLSPGESKSFDQAALGANRVWLQVGSAVGLQVVINDKPQDMPEKVGATYAITAAGISEQG